MFVEILHLEIVDGPPPPAMQKVRKAMHGRLHDRNARPFWMRASGKPCTEYTVSSTSDAVRKPKSSIVSHRHTSNLIMPGLAAAVVSAPPMRRDWLGLGELKAKESASRVAATQTGVQRTIFTDS